MRKKALSLALALALCLGLTIPAFAAGTDPNTFDDGDITVTNVIEHVEVDKDFGSFYVYEALTCVTPVSITLNRADDDSYSLSVERIPEGRELQDLELGELEQLPVNGTIELTESGSYYVMVGWSPTDEYSGGFVGYLLTVQPGSETAPNVPTTDPTTTTPQTASPTNDALTADGVLQTPTVYKINGSNYFKIRDLAAILNGTSKQFSVGYDGALKSVTATTGQGYTKQPGDLAGAPAGGNKIAEPSNDAIYINGEKIAAEVYKIDGSNYFKLRDLGAALDFYVGYSAETGVFLETDKPYSK